jgi:hypothetical protein
VDSVKLLSLPKILDKRGNLTFLEGKSHIPFYIKRVYWIYDVPGGQKRGGHAYKKLNEVIIALSGSFDVIIDNGNKKEKITLNRSYYGLFVPEMIWRHLENFSTNSLCLILSSDFYKKSDYVKKYSEFKKKLYEKK